jgi:hypothetical protein
LQVCRGVSVLSYSLKMSPRAAAAFAKNTE